MYIAHLKRLFFTLCMLGGLALLLSACGGGNSGNNNTPAPSTPGASRQTSTTTTGGDHSSASVSNNVSLGAKPCPTSVSEPASWDPLIPTQTGVSKVESVTCAYLKGMPTLQALVKVRFNGSASLLDAYVYDNLTDATPKRIFTLSNLYRGEVRISEYNTLLSAQVDENSLENKNQSDATLKVDLYREFQWSAGAGTLVQIAFPGIFPDLTRYQAEIDQQTVHQSSQTWKLSATGTARAFGATLLHWSTSAMASIISGGRVHDIQAVVRLKNNAPASGILNVSMSRLEGNTNDGIWIITSVQSDGLTLSVPQSSSEIRSPITVKGTGTAFEGIIGTVTVLDHTATDIGQGTVQGANPNGSSTFSANITYQSTFKDGDEEGLLMLSQQSNAGNGLSMVVIIKVLLQ